MTTDYMESSTKTKPLPLSRDVLLDQGACCGSGCLNCPYVDNQGKSHVKGSTQVGSLSQAELNKV